MDKNERARPVEGVMRDSRRFIARMEEQGWTREDFLARMGEILGVPQAMRPRDVKNAPPK